MICSRCRRDKPDDAYSRRTDRPKGRASFCPACRRDASKEWYRRSLIKKGKAIAARLREERLALAPLATSDADRCCFHLWGPLPRCPRMATHQCPVGGAWRACSEHQLPGDEPIAYLRQHSAANPVGTA